MFIQDTANICTTGTIENIPATLTNRLSSLLRRLTSCWEEVDIRKQNNIRTYAIKIKLRFAKKVKILPRRFSVLDILKNWNRF